MKAILIAALALGSTILAASAHDKSARVGILPPGMCVTATDTIVPCQSLIPALTSQNTTCVTPEGQRTSCPPPPQGYRIPPLDWTPGYDPKPDLAGTRWQVRSINGQATLPRLGTPSLIFKKDLLHISTVCRGFNADILSPYSATRFEIRPDPMIAKLCSDDLEEQEHALATAIGTATRIIVDDTLRLIIFSPDNNILVAFPMKEK